MNESGIDAAAKALLGKFSAEESTGVDPLVQKALFLASELQKRAHALQTPEERKQQTELDRMIQNPTDKVTLTALTDQAFRSEAAARSADQLVHILDVQGIPRFFSPLERTLLIGVSVLWQLRARGHHSYGQGQDAKGDCECHHSR